MCTHTCDRGHACLRKHTLTYPEALRIWPAAAAADVDNSISGSVCVKLMVYTDIQQLRGSYLLEIEST